MMKYNSVMEMINAFVDGEFTITTKRKQKLPDKMQLY